MTAERLEMGSASVSDAADRAVRRKLINELQVLDIDGLWETTKRTPPMTVDFAGVLVSLYTASPQVIRYLERRYEGSTTHREASPDAAAAVVHNASAHTILVLSRDRAVFGRELTEALVYTVFDRRTCATSGGYLRHPEDSEPREHLLSDCDLSEFAADLLEMEILQILSAQRTWCLVHASSVEKHGGAILLTGPSGSAKTMLSVSLSLGEARLLNDDMTCLDMATARVRYFPGSPRVRESALQRISIAFPRVGTRAAILSRALMAAREADHRVQLYPLRAIICLEGFARRPAVSRLTPRNAAVLLAKQVMIRSVESIPEFFCATCRMTSSVECISLRVGGLLPTLEVIERYLAPHC